MIHRPHLRLPHVRVLFIDLIFGFWLLQLLGWVVMIVYVQLFDQSLGEQVLYVTQISHWALVESAATAVLSSWAILQSRHNSRRLTDLHRQLSLDTAAIEGDIIRLASMVPGDEATALAITVTRRVKGEM